jgi:hydrogenase expression/formation protein HypD
MGFGEYEPISEKYKIPVTITGFEPVDILQGILMTVEELENKRYGVRNQYARVVSREGNQAAKQLIATIYKVSDRKWRGIGSIPNSGWELNEAHAAYDADRIFNTGAITRDESPLCIAGDVLQGLRKPSSCPAFGKECKPENPLGAPMVSSEGACSAYYRYKKN